jgi:alpha-tubulin suppressor-like RCC1 family protein
MKEKIIQLSHSQVLLGDGTVRDLVNSDRSISFPGKNIIQIASTSTGEYTICLLNDGTIQSWGDPINHGALPNFEGRRVVQIAIGDFHSLALLEDMMTVVCWGQDIGGNLIGSKSFYNNTPGYFSYFSQNKLKIKQIGCGLNYCAVLLEDGTMRCWGDNTYNQAPPSLSYPDTYYGVKEIACGYNHSLALISYGSIRCWGNNSVGQAPSDEIKFNFGRYPGHGRNYNSVIKIACCLNVSVVLLDDGAIRCWGQIHSLKLDFMSNDWLLPYEGIQIDRMRIIDIYCYCQKDKYVFLFLFNNNYIKKIEFSQIEPIPTVNIFGFDIINKTIDENEVSYDNPLSLLDGTKLTNRIKCKLCNVNEIKKVLNCGHLLCNKCANYYETKECPMCNKKITTRNEIYYKKYMKYKNKYVLLKRGRI